MDHIKPMLIGADSEPFDSVDCLYELKLDGERCIAYLDGSTKLHNKRNMLLLPRFPELRDIHCQVKTACILDGELMVMKDGAPSFFEMQRRSLLTHPVKIGLALTQYPASFVAFDILEIDGKSLLEKPLIERKQILQDTIVENECIAVSRYIQEQGTMLYDLAEQQHLEGVVAKRKNSLYYPGKRTKEWIKIKNLLDDDFVVCGYIEKGKGITSVVLGQFDEMKKLRYKGHVTLGVSGESFQVILQVPKRKTPPLPVPAGNENAIWIRPKLVGTVQYMMKTQSGGLRQPVWKGLRFDKQVQECVEKKERQDE